MENKHRDKSNANRNQEIVFRNCNIKKLGQKCQEKNDLQYNLQKQNDLTRTPNTLQNSLIFKQYNDNQQTSFHSSFQNSSNPNNLSQVGQIKNHPRNIYNINQYENSQNYQRHQNLKIDNSDSNIHSKNNQHLQNNDQDFTKNKHSPLKKSQNAQNMEIQEKDKKNNFENKFQLFNQATYLNKINLKQSEYDLNNHTQESSYIEYAKKIIKQSDEQLQLLQKLTPRKRSQDKYKKPQNQFHISTEKVMFQKVINEDFQNQKSGSKLKIVDCSPQIQDENYFSQKLKKSKKPSQKQNMNQEQYIIDQIKLEYSRYQKRTKNRPKSSGFSHQQSQYLRKKSNKKLLISTQNHSKLDVSSKSKESLINSTLKNQQNLISVSIVNDKDNKMDSCISIRQYGTPIKNSKSLKKLNNTKKEVSKSLVFGKQNKESTNKLEKQKIEEVCALQKAHQKQSQISHRVQKNTTQRCQSSLNKNESFVKQRVKNMQDEYLKSKQLDSSKDISFRRNQIVQQNNREEKILANNKLKIKDSQNQNQTTLSSLKQIDLQKFKFKESQSYNLLQNENQNKQKQINLFQDDLNNKIELIRQSQPNFSNALQNENGKIVQKNYLRASKNLTQKKQSCKIVEQQMNDSVMEELQQQTKNIIKHDNISKYQKLPRDISNRNQDNLKQNEIQEKDIRIQFQNEELQQKKQIFSHIKIVTKPPENVQQEMNRISQKQFADLMINKNSAVSVSPQKIKTKNVSPQNQTKQKLHLIFAKFGAVLKGYKTRRIYNHSKLVKQDRFEFRDLIQFAYSLKQELAQLQNKIKEISPMKDKTQSFYIKQKLDAQIEQTKKLLLQSLKDLIQKRQQFSIHFIRLLEGNAEWIYESRNFRTKNCNTPDAKYSQRNFLRKSQSLEPFISSTINTKKKFQITSPNKIQNTLKSPSYKNTENSSFKGSKMQSELKDQVRKTDTKQTLGQGIRNSNNEEQFKSQYIKHNWNEQNKIDQEQINKSKNINMKNEDSNAKQNTYKNEYFNKGNYCGDHLNKKLFQKRQISQLTFGESADIHNVNQSRTDSIMDIRKLQKDTQCNQNQKIRVKDDNFNSLKESPSKKFQSNTNVLLKGFNSINQSPKKSFKTKDQKEYQSNLQVMKQKIDAISPKKNQQTQKVNDPFIIQNNYEHEMLIIGKERDQLIEEQQQAEADNKSIQVSGQKRNFLKKGEKSRKHFDPQRSIQNQRLQKQQSQEKQRKSLIDQKNDQNLQTLSTNEFKERSNSLVFTSQNKNKNQNQRTLTPQSHKKSLNKFIQGYQSPYQQVNSQISIISVKNQEEVKVETKKEIELENQNKRKPHQSLQQMKEQRWINKLNNNCTLRYEQECKSFQKGQDLKELNQQNQEIISISIQQNQLDINRKSINFVSKIPRLSSVSASLTKSEIQQKNTSPIKSPVKQIVQKTEIVNKMNQINKNQFENQPQNIEIKKLSYQRVEKGKRLIVENKSDNVLRQSDQNQTFTSHHSSIIERSSNRKNSIIEYSKSSNNQASKQQKKEHLLEINEIIKQQNLQYIKNLSQNKQTKHSSKMSNYSNQELSQELNKIRQSLVFKNLGIQKNIFSSKPVQKMNEDDNNQLIQKESQNQQQIQSFNNQQKLSMSASKKILQMSKSKPSNRYHEKSESDTFSQINLNDNFKKESYAILNMNESQKQIDKLNEFQNFKTNEPEIIQRNESFKNIFYSREQEAVQVKTERENHENQLQTFINRQNEYSPSIKDISAAGSNIASPYSKNTQRQIINLEKLTPIKNMNFENQYVANLKKNKADGASSPKRPIFLKQNPQKNFAFNLSGLTDDKKKDKNTISQENISQPENQQNYFQQMQQNQIRNEVDEQGPECEMTISIFDNKKSFLNLGLSSNFESQTSSFQKESKNIFQNQIQNQKNDDQNNIYNNIIHQEKLQQLEKRNEGNLSRFLNHNQDMKQSACQNESSQDKDTSTFRIQPLKINSIANSSSLMSSVRGEMIIANNIQNNYNPIQSCNHTKYNSVYDVISTSVINPCCSEYIHKYNQSPSAKSNSPIHKMGSMNKNQDYQSQNEIYSPKKKSPSKIQFNQSHSKENINDQVVQNFSQFTYLNENPEQDLNITENQVFLYPQIIQGKQNKDIVKNDNINHYESIQILQSSENKNRATESRRRSRGERTSQQKQQSTKHNQTFKRGKLSANVLSNLPQNKVDRKQIEEIEQQYVHTQNSLEHPDENVPIALPTPQRHDYREYQIRTPTKNTCDDKLSTFNSNNKKTISQYDIEASCNKNKNSKRLTQKKRSQEGRNIQVSPFKTPQKQTTMQFKKASENKQQSKADYSYNKSQQQYDNQYENDINNEIDSQKVAATIEQLKFVLSRLKNQETIQNQYISEEQFAKQREIEKMIKNLQEQQMMFNQFIKEQTNKSIR